MSAPAGWHLQPDGRERFWDGTQWTDQFRSVDPTPVDDPTAPPPAPEWDQTQALDVSSTQAMPAPQPGYAASDPYASQPSAYGAATGGAPVSGYGAPGQPWQGAPPPQRGSGLAKGCLIAAVVGFLVLVLAVVLAIFFISRTVDEVRETFPTILPTEVPSGLPTDLPSGLPTDGVGEQIGITVGQGFDIPRATIEDGWSLNKQGAGALSVVTVDGMRATLQDQDGFPVLFTISFPPADGGEPVQTVCTAPAGSAGASVEVSCVPLLGDVADARQGTVTTTL